MINIGDRVIVCSSRASCIGSGVRRIIESFGLVPFIYEGVNLRTRSSTLDREIRDDFYSAKLIVVLLNPLKGALLSDNWAIPELPYVTDRHVVIFASDQVPSDDVKQLKLPVIVIEEAQFESRLQSYLKHLIPNT